MAEAAASLEPAGQVVPRRQRWATVTTLTGAAVVSLIVLDWLAPFRFGLLSAALYATPVIVAIVAARTTRTIPMAHGRRRVLGRTLALLAGLLVLAVSCPAPVGWRGDAHPADFT